MRQDAAWGGLGLGMGQDEDQAGVSYDWERVI